MDEIGLAQPVRALGRRIVATVEACPIHLFLGSPLMHSALHAQELDGHGMTHGAGEAETASRMAIASAANPA